MDAPTPRTYRTAAFAALAGVTPRTLHHYDRLGLLRPQRSTGGYRLYQERDLETLEEIVALKFIGVPLKDIAAVRRRPPAAFIDVLRAQRASLEARQRGLAKAIDAVGTAERWLSSHSSSRERRLHRISTHTANAQSGVGAPRRVVAGAGRPGWAVVRRRRRRPDEASGPVVRERRRTGVHPPSPRRPRLSRVPLTHVSAA